MPFLAHLLLVIQVSNSFAYAQLTLFKKRHSHFEFQNSPAPSWVDTEINANNHKIF
jgi:cephalosporin-C deacetylase-like acetyl esterase